MSTVRKRSMRGLTAMLGVAALALAACGGADANSQGVDGPFDPSSELGKLIAAAEEEGTVNYVFTGPPEVLVEMNEVFNETFGTHITIEPVALRAAEVPGRLREEMNAGKVTIDVAHVQAELFSSLGDDLPFQEAFDYVDVLADADLPYLDLVVDRVPDVAKGKALEYQHLVRGFIYNTDVVKGDDIPDEWEDLADPKWSGGKLALDPEGSSTVQLIAKWSVDEVVDFSTGLLDLEPLWIGGASNIAEAVARGEAYVGVTSISNVKDLQDEGLPIEIAQTGYNTAASQVIFPVKDAPHPNAAKLWSAWEATVGVTVGGELGFTNERAWPEEGTWSAKKLEELEDELIVLTDDAQTAAQAEARDRIVEAYSKAGVSEE